MFMDMLVGNSDARFLQRQLILMEILFTEMILKMTPILFYITLQSLVGHMMVIQFMVHMDMQIKRVAQLSVYRLVTVFNFNQIDQERHSSHQVFSQKIMSMLAMETQIFIMEDIVRLQSSQMVYMLTLQQLTRHQNLVVL